jgi:hypothetical protein
MSIRAVRPRQTFIREQIMNPSNGRLPAGDAALDAALEQFSRLSVPADVERRLATRLQEFCRQPHAERAVPTPQRRIHRRFVRASVAAGLAAMVVVGLFLAFGNQDAWAQVAKAMRSKPWVRWTFRVPTEMTVPESFQAPECWFSAEKKVFAGRANQSVHYVDLGGQETYDFMPQTNALVRSLTSDIDNVELGHFETLLRLVAEWDRALKVPESPIQIVGRARRDVPDGDRRWTEYTFACRDARRAHKDYQVTFRVDPQTQLPVEMRSTEKYSADDPASERTYVIDYPEAGPSDVYALGVPRDAKVVDRRRAHVQTTEEIKDFLAAYVQARAKPLAPYRMTVLKSGPGRDFSDIYSVFRVKDDADQLQVEEIDFEQLLALRKRLRSGEIARPKDVDPAVWWRQQVKEMKFKSRQEGGEILPHQVGYPPELMTIGASPVDNPDCRVTLDRKPVLGPAGTVLLRIRTETTLGFNDCFFWIAPERDYLVLRHEIHFSRDHGAWNNSTQVIDKVEKSPGGRWYATVVRSGRIEKHGGDLPAKLIPPIAEPKMKMRMGPVTTTSYRYFLDLK